MPGEATHIKSVRPEGSFKRQARLFHKYELRDRGAWDLRLAVLAWLGVFLAAYFDSKLQGAHLLDVALGVGVAVLAVVIAAITILTAFLTEEYGVLLKETFGGYGEVFYPYRLIAAVASATVLVSGIGLFVWPSATGWEKALLLAFSLGLAAWSTVGTFGLVKITADHGEIKMRLLPELRQAYKKRKAG